MCFIFGELVGVGREEREGVNTLQRGAGGGTHKRGGGARTLDGGLGVSRSIGSIVLVGLAGCPGGERKLFWSLR